MLYPFTMAFHDKAKVFEFEPTCIREEHMSQLMERIKRTHDNRNSRRQNQRLVKKIERQLRQSPSFLISFNLAEMYYNGVVGIPSDMYKTMEYYVLAWETATHSVSGSGIFPCLNNNMDEVCKVIETEALRKFTDRLHAAYKITHIPELELIATMFSARVADMTACTAKAIGLYRDAKAMAQSVGDNSLALECSERKAVLKAVGQHKLDKVIEKYTVRRQELEDPMDPHSTAGVSCPTINRGQVYFKTEAAAENAKVEMAAMGINMEPFGAVSVRVCATCGKPDFQKVFKTCSRCHDPRYCSKKCQKEHWSEHKHRCFPKN